MYQAIINTPGHLSEVDPIQAWATEANKPFDQHEQSTAVLSADQVKARDYVPSRAVKLLLSLYMELSAGNRDPWSMSDRDRAVETGTRYGVAMSMRMIIGDESCLTDPEILDEMIGEMINEAKINRA